MIKIDLKDVFDIPADEMTIFTLGENSLRGAIFNGRILVEQMQAQHNLGILETLCLGHACLCVAMFIPMMKGRERVIFRYETDRKIPGFSVEASSAGWVRGYLFENNIELNTALESWDLAPFFGDGFVTVIRYPENAKKTITGTIQIKHKNIAQDLTEYFLQSEQTQTAITSSIKFDKKGKLESVAALFLQAMPDAKESVLEEATKNFNAIGSLAEFVQKNGDLKTCVEKAFSTLSPNILISRHIEFNCPCSKALFLSKIKLLPEDEIKDLANQEKCEVICQNCSSVYTYKKSEIQTCL
ncbi:MAG: Hsp33 family molecular chaperone HslO [Treponemataceae bacterium]